MADPKWSMPTSKQRVSIYGHTGSGKSQQAVWYLSKAPIESMPYVIIDYKGDDLINEIPYAHNIGFNETPRKPGVYILHPQPGQDDEVERFLWGVYERGRTGLYVDEGYMMPKAPKYKAFPAIMVQGRSKHIPMITLTQKPFYVPMHALSEADFHSVFYLSDDNDKKRVREFTGFTKEEMDRHLPDYHSQVYRVRDRAKFILKPVPEADSLLETFERRLAPKHRVL